MAGTAADVKGKQLTLSFDAVSQMAEVYINGESAGSNIGMFGDFQVDATRFLRPGRNLIAVKVTRDINGKAAQTSDAWKTTIRQYARKWRITKTTNRPTKPY